MTVTTANLTPDDRDKKGQQQTLTQRSTRHSARRVYSRRKQVNLSFCIAQYPILRIPQSALHFTFTAKVARTLIHHCL